MSAQRLSRTRCFDGWMETWSHASSATRTEMKFSVFVPPQAATRKVPVLWWLSGLTCTEENFMAKSGAQRYAAEHGILLVAPDTSPRGANIEGEGASWDFGLGAGFYVNATEPKWSGHYRMYEYVTEELPSIVRERFPAAPDREAISGHSMGGHGALVIALRNPGRFRSVSAFAPIVAPSQVPWGIKAFTGYLGSDRAAWAEYDATALVAGARERLPLLIDQGTEDKFLAEQLKPELLARECERAGHPIELRMREGYDHSYYFVASFIGEHIAHHARYL